MHPYLNTAISAARSAGNIIMRGYRDRDRLEITQKGENDFVSQVDKAAETRVMEVINRAYPDHAFIGEESGAHGDSDTIWIIDPLDGTTNFLHGIPHFAVSIGCQVEGEMRHAVVYNPWTQELYTASQGQGAELDGRKIRVSGQSTLKNSLLGTGFPIRAGESLDRYLPLFGKLMGETHGLRRAGAAALDLAYVAAGRLDAYWELNLSPWDIAAGMLLVTEAGGLVGELDGKRDVLKTGNIIAGSPKVYLELQKLLVK